MKPTKNGRKMIHKKDSQRSSSRLTKIIHKKDSQKIIQKTDTQK